MFKSRGDDRVIHVHASPIRSAFILLLLIVSLFSASQRIFSETLAFSLKDALETALKENKTINIFSIGKEISKNRVSFEGAIFIPEFSLSNENITFRKDQLSIDNYRYRNYQKYLLSLSSRIEDGSEVSVNFATLKNSYTTFLPEFDTGEYNSSLYLKYLIPLMRGYGKEVNLLNVDKAKIELETSTERYESIKSDVLFNVLKAYFELYRIREEIRVSKEIRKNTEAIYHIVREKVEMRKMPITEQLKMEVNLSVQSQNIVGLENDEKKRVNQLMLAIYNDPDREGRQGIELLTTPEKMIPKLSLPGMPEMLKRIENVDMELITLNNQLRSLEKDYAKTLNDLKPDLNLSTEVGMDGFDLGAWGNSIANVSSSNYRVNMALQYKFPLLKTRYESQAKEIQGNVDQIRIRMDNRKNEIKKNVIELLNDIRSVEEKVEIYEKVVSLAEENLNNETERLIRGKTTVLYTLDYQSDLSNSKLQLIRLTIDYLLLNATYSLYGREMEEMMKNL